MQFAVDLYETSSGHAVVEEELEAVERQSPTLHALLIAGLNKLWRSEYRRPPLCVPVQEGLFELRVGGRNIARAIWFFRRGQRTVVVRCFVKKTQRTPRAEIDVARQRMHDYDLRCGG